MDADVTIWTPSEQLKHSKRPISGNFHGPTANELRQTRSYITQQPL